MQYGTWMIIEVLKYTMEAVLGLVSTDRSTSAAKRRAAVDILQFPSRADPTVDPTKQYGTHHIQG